MFYKNVVLFILFFCFCQKMNAHYSGEAILARFVASLTAFTAVTCYDEFMHQQIHNPNAFDSNFVLTRWELTRGCLHAFVGPFSALGIPTTFLWETSSGLFGKHEKYYALRFCVYYTAFCAAYHIWQFGASKKPSSSDDSPPSYDQATRR